MATDKNSTNQSAGKGVKVEDTKADQGKLNQAPKNRRDTKETDREDTIEQVKREAINNHNREHNTSQ